MQHVSVTQFVKGAALFIVPSSIDHDFMIVLGENISVWARLQARQGITKGTLER